MRKWFRRWPISAIAIVLALMLVACGSGTPPLGFAPGKGLVRQAIALQLQLTGDRLARQLDAERPAAIVRRVRIRDMEPVYVASLPTYHVRGTFALKLDLPQQPVEQTNNDFDLYLQRQSEGKTWLLLSRQTADSENEAQWTSYLLKPF
ncbi:lipocalin/fatty-acid binding family protein [Rubidibacter lacunae]|nr:hypothetical protein [Rubidibacter lacunae]